MNLLQVDIHDHGFNIFDRDRNSPSNITLVTQGIAGAEWDIDLEGIVIL